MLLGFFVCCCNTSVVSWGGGCNLYVIVFKALCSPSVVGAVGLLEVVVTWLLCD